MTRWKMLAVITLASLGSLGTASVAQAAPSAQDSTWMVAAHQTNLTEIAAGKAAQAKAVSQSVKDAGAMFEAMHTQMDATLAATAKKLSVALPAAPNPAQQQTLASVSAQSGTAFDTAWVASQVAGHRTALAGTQAEVSAGSDATVVALATSAVPVIEQHLATVTALSADPSTVQAGTGGQAAHSDSATRPWLLALLLFGLVLVAGAAGRLVVARRSS